MQSPSALLVFALVILVAAVLYAPKLAGLFLVLLAAYYALALGKAGILTANNVP